MGRRACTMRPRVEYPCCLSSLCLIKWHGYSHCTDWYGTGARDRMASCCVAVQYLVGEAEYIMILHCPLDIANCHVNLHSHLCHIVLCHNSTVGWCRIHCAGLLHHAVWYCNCSAQYCILDLSHTVSERHCVVSCCTHCTHFSELSE